MLNFSGTCRNYRLLVGLARITACPRLDASILFEKRKYQRKKVHPFHGRWIAFGF